MRRSDAFTSVNVSALFSPLAACAGLLLMACPAFAQAPPADVGDTNRLTVRATRIREPIALDGRLDDSVYAEVQPVSDFIQQEPNEGERQKDLQEGKSLGSISSC